MVNHHLVFVNKVIFPLIQLAVFQDFHFSSLRLFLWPFCGIQKRYVEMVPVCDDQTERSLMTTSNNSNSKAMYPSIPESQEFTELQIWKQRLYMHVLGQSCDFQSGSWLVLLCSLSFLSGPFELQTHTMRKSFAISSYRRGQLKHLENWKQ